MITLVKYFEVYGKVQLFYLPCFVSFLDVNWSLIWCLIPFQDIWEEDDLPKFWLKSKGGWFILLVFSVKNYLLSLFIKV